jgi:hypothetical protein
MNLLTPTQHAGIDVLTVVVFALAPVALGLGGTAATLSYALAGVHLLMTLLTAGLPGSPGRLVPLPLHGLVEAVVGVALGLVGWLAFDGTEQAFYLVMAALILLVFAITPYLGSSA